MKYSNTVAHNKATDFSPAAPTCLLFEAYKCKSLVLVKINNKNLKTFVFNPEKLKKCYFSNILKIRKVFQIANNFSFSFQFQHSSVSLQDTQRESKAMTWSSTSESAGSGRNTVLTCSKCCFKYLKKKISYMSSDYPQKRVWGPIL